MRRFCRIQWFENFTPKVLDFFHLSLIIPPHRFPFHSVFQFSPSKSFHAWKVSQLCFWVFGLILSAKKLWNLFWYSCLTFEGGNLLVWWLEKEFLLSSKNEPVFWSSVLNLEFQRKRYWLTFIFRISYRVCSP